MSKQKIFEKIIKHLIKQKVRSYDYCDIGCVYRGPNGTKCAVGCLLTDKIYRSDMEGNNIRGVISIYKYYLPKYIIDNEDFLSDIQFLHDEKINWNKNGLKRLVIKDFAKRHNLSIDFLKEI